MSDSRRKPREHRGRRAAGASDGGPYRRKRFAAALVLGALASGCATAHKTRDTGLGLMLAGGGGVGLAGGLSLGIDDPEPIAGVVVVSGVLVGAGLVLLLAGMSDVDAEDRISGSAFDE